MKDKSFRAKALVNLDIEGGRNPQKGFYTVHHEQLPGVDMVWDFYQTPYPFPDGSFDIVRADRILEKIPRLHGGLIAYMNEIWRILQYEGQFMIATSYPGSYIYHQDPLNVNPVNEATFAYFDPLEQIAGKDLYAVYKPKPWKLEHISFASNGIMEVLLSKRREDKSYGKNTC